MIVRALTVWLGILCLAVINGIARESIVTPIFGENLALPLSGVILSIVIFFVAYFSFDFISAKSILKNFIVGALWVLMTLIFEFVFGYFIVGKPWLELLQVFNLAKGELFSLVLLISFLSPFCIAKIKKVI